MAEELTSIQESIKNRGRPQSKYGRFKDTTIHDDQRTTVMTALNQVILTSNHPDNFQERFLNSVNILSTLINAVLFKTNKKTVQKANTVAMAQDIFKNDVRAYFGRMKESDISVEEMIEINRVGLKEHDYFGKKRKRPLETYDTNNNIELVSETDGLQTTK